MGKQSLLKVLYIYMYYTCVYVRVWVSFRKIIEGEVDIQSWKLRGEQSYVWVLFKYGKLFQGGKYPHTLLIETLYMPAYVSIILFTQYYSICVCMYCTVYSFIHSFIRIIILEDHLAQKATSQGHR